VTRLTIILTTILTNIPIKIIAKYIVCSMTVYTNYTMPYNI